MSDPITTCNQALGWLGANTITSFDDATKEAQLCKVNYPLLRDVVTEARVWSFADTSEILTAPSLNAFGQAQYFMPTGWLRVYRVAIGVDPGTTVATPWSVQGRYVTLLSTTRSGAASIFCKAIRQVIDYSQYTPGFTQVLAARLAADLALPIARSRQLQADMWGLYESKLSEAAAADASQGSTERTDSSTLTGARWGDGLGGAR